MSEVSPVFLLKVFSISTLLAILIKYGLPQVVSSPSVTLALGLVLTPTILLAVALALWTYPFQSPPPNSR